MERKGGEWGFSGPASHCSHEGLVAVKRQTVRDTHGVQTVGSLSRISRFFAGSGSSKSGPGAQPINTEHIKTVREWRRAWSAL